MHTQEGVKLAGPTNDAKFVSNPTLYLASQDLPYSAALIECS